MKAKNKALENFRGAHRTASGKSPESIIKSFRRNVDKSIKKSGLSRDEYMRRVTGKD